LSSWPASASLCSSEFWGCLGLGKRVTGQSSDFICDYTTSSTTNCTLSLPFSVLLVFASSSLDIDTRRDSNSLLQREARPDKWALCPVCLAAWGRCLIQVTWCLLTCMGWLARPGIVAVFFSARAVFLQHEQVKNLWGMSDVASERGRIPGCHMLLSPPHVQLNSPDSGSMMSIRVSRVTAAFLEAGP